MTTPYVAIDIETTGLEPSWCQTIEVAAVIDMGNGQPHERLPRWHCYVAHDRIVGEPFALSMHAEILRRIATREKGYTYHKPEFVMKFLAKFLFDHGIDQFRVTAAGKNFGSFDLQFLKMLPDYGRHVKFHHRSIDVVTEFWRPTEDIELPDTKTCLERAGLPAAVSHKAMADAEQIVHLVRHVIRGKQDALVDSACSP